MAKVGLAYDLIKLDQLNEFPIDCVAELDSEETIQAVEQAIKSGGHEVILLEADDEFADRLRTTHPDIVFNVAEGIQGDCRESHVPAMCEFFGIPYTGSGILTLSICLNKAVTNQVLESNHILVPPFQVFHSHSDVLRGNLEFPLIVKLLHEGSSMGLSKKSVVKDEPALRDQVEFVINTYHQPALVQKFILGREFTVGILGNYDPYTLPITEVIFEDPYGIVTFCPDDEVLPMVGKARGKQFLTELKKQVIPREAVCPAKISPELADQINTTAIKAFKALGCRDWCRIDLRMDKDGDLYILELNPIAGIGSGYWLPKSAQVAGLNYDQFINTILDIALERINSKISP